MIYNNYEDEYIESIDKDNFEKIFNLFKSNGLYFINDIVLNYLEIFTINYNDITESLNELKLKLGKDYVYIIGRNMTYLDELIKEEA